MRAAATPGAGNQMTRRPWLVSYVEASSGGATESTRARIPTAGRPGPPSPSSGPPRAALLSAKTEASLAASGLLCASRMPQTPGAMLFPTMNDAQPVAEMTLDEWAAMDEDEEGELVDGILVEEEMPSASHELIVTWLARLFGNWLAGRGFVIGSEAKFAVAARRGRKPDLTVYLPGRKPESHGVIRVPPDIAIEIVSPTPRDERR